MGRRVCVVFKFTASGADRDEVGCLRTLMITDELALHVCSSKKQTGLDLLQKSNQQDVITQYMCLLISYYSHIRILDELFSVYF